MLSTKLIDSVKHEAYRIHASVNQQYGYRPYSVHLSAVCSTALWYGKGFIPEEDSDIIIFASLFHDTIEDARLTYSDVLREAKELRISDPTLATEIVYALTNEKGRTREERAGDSYYEGIRKTKYASFVKACDRFANASEGNEKYRKEMKHFLEVIGDIPEDLKRDLGSFIPPSEIV